MLRLIEDIANTYAPYAMTNRELTESVSALKVDLTNLFTVDVVTIGIDGVVPANAVADFNGDPTKTGYTPLGVVGFAVNSGGYHIGTTSIKLASPTYVVARLINNSSSNVTIESVSIWILYKKN